MMNKLNREEKIFLLKSLQEGQIIESNLLKAIPAMAMPVVKHKKVTLDEAASLKGEHPEEEIPKAIKLTKKQKLFLIEQLSKGSIDTTEVSKALRLKGNTLTILMVESGHRPASSEQEVKMLYE